MYILFLDKTNLELVILQQDDSQSKVSSAHIHYVDSEELRSITTDSSGTAKVSVTGCRPSLTVHAKGRIRSQQKL